MSKLSAIICCAAAFVFSLFSVLFCAELKAGGMLRKNARIGFRNLTFESCLFWPPMLKYFYQNKGG